MDPEYRSPNNPMDAERSAVDKPLAPEPLTATMFASKPEPHPLRTIFLGPQGLRAGWSIAIFMALMALFVITLSSVVHYVLSDRLHVKVETGSAWQNLISESLLVLGLLGAGAIVARIEHRRIRDYNLSGPRRLQHLLVGLLFGFAALSALVGAMTWGGWMHFGPVALTGAQFAKFAVLWGAGFMLVACSEEGAVRCYLQYTLTRGLNFWWALGLVALICASLLIFQSGQGLWGVYAIALLGLAPCLSLELSKRPGRNFWLATWVTSTFFGFIHTGNNGENWIGIFAAAGIGFVFCVSIYVTGSAWWAIGAHAAWDWAETFFYGTADSGFAAKGHFLTTVPSGSIFYSGGADGPEGSILIIPVMLVLLAALLAVYGRRRREALGAARVEQPGGAERLVGLS